MAIGQGRPAYPRRDPAHPVRPDQERWDSADTPWPANRPALLRHTFATWYICRGGKVAVLKEILGHDKIETAMLYVTLAGVDVSADHALYSSVGQLGLIRENPLLRTVYRETVCVRSTESP